MHVHVCALYMNLCCQVMHQSRVHCTMYTCTCIDLLKQLSWLNWKVTMCTLYVHMCMCSSGTLLTFVESLHVQHIHSTCTQCTCTQHIQYSIYTVHVHCVHNVHVRVHSIYNLFTAARHVHMYMYVIMYMYSHYHVYIMWCAGGHTCTCTCIYTCTMYMSEWGMCMKNPFVLTIHNVHACTCVALSPSLSPTHPPPPPLLSGTPTATA